MAKKYEAPDEEMSVEIDIDGEIINCEVITIFTVDDRDYIAVLPKNSKNYPDDEVWIYRYGENPDDPNEEPTLEYIESEEEYEKAADAFDEFLDELEFEDTADDDE